MAIRNTAKALILRDGKLLLNRCEDPCNGVYYTLPGGGQNQYEALEDAVVRECLEETGCKVSPVKLAALCEEICDDPAVREAYPDYAHKLYHIFLCEVSGETAAPTERDRLQLDSEWIKLADASQIGLLPKLLSAQLMEVLDGAAPLFLGTEHLAKNHG